MWFFKCLRNNFRTFNSFTSMVPDPSTSNKSKASFISCFWTSFNSTFAAFFFHCSKVVWWLDACNKYTCEWKTVLLEFTNSSIPFPSIERTHSPLLMLLVTTIFFSTCLLRQGLPMEPQLACNSQSSCLSLLSMTINLLIESVLLFFPLDFPHKTSVFEERSS